MRHDSRSATRYALYLAVLPKYRTECIKILHEQLGDELSIFISDAHLDESVRSGIPEHLFKSVSIHRILKRRAFIQTGHIAEALRAETSIVDLNPRSVTAWLILLVRAVLRRRTLVWGHIHPQAGPQSKTAFLRLMMRRLASGTLSYTYRDAEKASADLPGKLVWVAPNSLYRASVIQPAIADPPLERTELTYVGRFAPAKKVDLLVRAFAKAVASIPEMRLRLIGGGVTEQELRLLAHDLGVAEKVEFSGWIDELDALRPYYERSFCSTSPGFAGLGLTQSLGFGVPMIVADDEPHSPEIELAAVGGVEFFAAESVDEMADSIIRMWETKERMPLSDVSEYVRDRYSAEAMADGLKSALTNAPGYSSLEGIK
ncbi:glycosyltransferase [Paenarthrobacter sp. JL.01a]|uniref:glycosyltransferase n=1 Tax=Paenarthrobacter sp. JL.01a TaxID=2979324 RepID=UPI0021C66A01|nr:glycosyltransferase [Paenarthrobacter sp. JL.01a]UXM90756.1 glycosyltransferase [Paenarthrobacter sp. JL.01a]